MLLNKIHRTKKGSEGHTDGQHAQGVQHEQWSRKYKWKPHWDTTSHQSKYLELKECTILSLVRRESNWTSRNEKKLYNRFEKLFGGFQES